MNSMIRAFLTAVVVLLPLCLPTAGEEKADVGYEIGGALAGVKLPLYKTQHGEPPGYPGCIPELQAEARAKDPGSTEFTPQGQFPELELYPGAVEHWRAYWFHYMPIRSFFDVQSQLKNWAAPDLPGADKGQVEEYAEPVYWVGMYIQKPTGRSNKPVPVVRCKTRAPVFRLDLGELKEGLYAVRVIGAVETKALRAFRLPAFVALRVNDGLNGEAHQYRRLAGYVDEFYSVAEMYFHAPAKRRYSAELWFDEGTQVDVLVHNITLDDALAGTDDRTVKTKPLAMHTPAEISDLVNGEPSRYMAKAISDWKATRGNNPEMGREERWARDAILWKGVAHANQQFADVSVGAFKKQPGDNWGNGGTTYGVGGKSMDEIEKEYGQWQSVYPLKSRAVSFPLRDKDLAALQTLLVNEKLGLKYTMEDLENGRPLPDPYPYKDTGAGTYTPDPNDPAKGQVFWPIARTLNEEYNGFRAYLETMDQGSVAWMKEKAEVPARDAAVALIRFAYVFPTLETYYALPDQIQDCWHRNRTLLRRRETCNYVYGNFILYLQPLEYYDRLFDYIRGNEDLAQSVSRFVPWVKTSDDVVRLLDVYLLQTMAKRVLRYRYFGDGRQPFRIAEVAACAGDNAFTRPWMEWLFSRVFFYPQRLAGLGDHAITSVDRDGRSPIGSYNYMLGEYSADVAAMQIEKYISLGGDARFSLRDPQRYPKIIASMDFYSRSRTAGSAFPRIGDVTGPEGRSQGHFDKIIDRAPTFWRWTKAPQFAWVVKNLGRRTLETDAEWREIEDAAATVKRAPWLDNRSRILSGWGAFLETGVQYDDFRFRRSAMLRTGCGVGHSHSDTLDLQIYAHGLPMTVDGGQRGGYSEPGDSRTRVHNTVEVNGQNWGGNSWTQAMSDAEGARYARCQAVPLFGTRIFRRQLALIDVDEGQGPATHVTPAQMGPDIDGLPKAGATPNSYVFDVFRVSGGASHAYCFHAMVNDDFAWNATATQPAAQAPKEDQDYVNFFGAAPEKRSVGDAPDVLEATWRLTRASGGPEDVGEPKYLGSLYDPASPRKFTRLHLLGASGERAYHADAVCNARGYQFTCLMARRTGEGLESVFPALIDPYVGEPNLLECRALDIADNEADALRAVAVEAKTRNGRTDVCFADGRPEKERQLRTGGPGLRISGEFAYLSTDDAGLRQATLTGGTLLQSPLVRIETAARERRGKVVRVDYPARKAWIDARWPACGQERIVEIGDVAGGGAGGYVTGYTVSSVQPEGDGSVLLFRESADYYRAPVQSVEREETSAQPAALVACALSPRRGGIGRGLAASNEARTRSWRAEVVGDTRFRITGGPVAQADFGPENVLRLWEYGVGDTVRQSTRVSLRRIEPGVFEVDLDVDAEVRLKAASAEKSSDKATWTPVPAVREGEAVRIGVRAADCANGTILLRVK